MTSSQIRSETNSSGDVSSNQDCNEVFLPLPLAAPTWQMLMLNGPSAQQLGDAASAENTEASPMNRFRTAARLAPPPTVPAPCRLA